MRALRAEEKTNCFISIHRKPAFCAKHVMKKEPYNGRGAYHISGSTTYILQRIVASPVKTLYTFSVSEHVMQELNLVVKDYFEKHIDKKFQSAQMLDDLLLF